MSGPGASLLGRAMLHNPARQFNQGFGGYGAPGQDGADHGHAGFGPRPTHGHHMVPGLGSDVAHGMSLGHGAGQGQGLGGGQGMGMGGVPMMGMGMPEWGQPQYPQADMYAAYRGVPAVAGPTVGALRCVAKAAGDYGVRRGPGASVLQAPL